MNNTPRICTVCGKPFTPKFPLSRAKTCQSVECLNELSRRAGLKSMETRRRKKGKLLTRHCLKCDTEFTTYNRFNRLCRACQELNEDFHTGAEYWGATI